MDRHTDRQYENITFPHMRAVKKGSFLTVCRVKGMCAFGIISRCMILVAESALMLDMVRY